MISIHELRDSIREALSDANSYANYEVRIEVIQNLTASLVEKMFTSELGRDEFMRSCGLEDWSA